MIKIGDRYMDKHGTVWEVVYFERDEVRVRANHWYNWVQPIILSSQWTKIEPEKAVM